MRSIINISLPRSMNAVIEKELKKSRFATKSEFFRMLIRRWLEDQLLGELEESRSEFRAGKGKLLRSLKDLR